MLGENFKKSYKSIMEKFENKESSLIALLHEIQKENGYILEEDLEELSKLTNINYSRIKSVATFYTMFNLKKVGKYHIQICRNLSCHMAGAKKLVDYIKNELNIKEGEVSEDGYFSFTEVECLGACGTAPVIMVNDKYYENMDEDKLVKLIEELKRKKE